MSSLHNVDNTKVYFHNYNIKLNIINKELQIPLLHVFTSDLPILVKDQYLHRLHPATNPLQETSG